MRWLNSQSQKFLEADYLLPGQSVKDRIEVICDRAEEILKESGFSKRYQSHIANGWTSCSSPVWTNMGHRRGLPISCFGSFVDDSVESIVDAESEVSIMSKWGGGTSASMHRVRGRGMPITDNGFSDGSVHFLRMFDTAIDTISQGATRRGSFAAYQRLDHPDILEFLTIKVDKSPLQNINSGVCVPPGFLEAAAAGDKKKRKVWAEVLKTRQKVGYPYILFLDNINRQRPEWYQTPEYEITQSNLCTEIMLPNSLLESFVCDLGSLNMLYYPEWRGTTLVRDSIFFLDAVMTDFIERARNIKHLERAVRFAQRHRALGLGWLGWHSHLQDQSIAFDSPEAMRRNAEIAKYMWDEADAASREAASIYGEPDVLKGTGRRNTTLMAIAPTKSSAFILGQASESIEMFKNNWYERDLAKGDFMPKNPHLKALLATKGENTKAVWQSILENRGSVRHLEFLSDHEKDVYATRAEVSPLAVITQAAQRQRWIDQGQSTNLFIDPSTPPKQVSQLYVHAWEVGIKSLYYQKNVNASQSLAQDIMQCRACEG